MIMAMIRLLGQTDATLILLRPLNTIFVYADLVHNSLSLLTVIAAAFNLTGQILYQGTLMCASMYKASIYAYAVTIDTN